MKTISLLAVALLAALPLGAQQPHSMGDPMALQDMMGPMMPVLLYTSQHLLARKDALGLTPNQVARLTALRNATQTEQEAATREAKSHMQAIQQAATGPMADTVALKAHFDAAHAAMGRAHWLSIAAAVQAKGVLNDAQRKQVTVWADSMQAWMQQHRQMMQPSQPH